ncbi:Glu-tRNA(Gln) amidotransferase subunit GatD [Candidatus Micrarchaeota archaeon]|nr:Glu-tRNA(Gln) amidotransferase subunit GatD [Candidatus Micrarchaeota archaeon]
MYSEKIQSALSKAGAKPGSRVRVAEGKRVFEGILLPRPDAGDENCLVVKLSSGYNVGITFDAKTKVEALKGGAELEKFAKARKKFDLHLPSVSMIATGGTISNRVDYRTGGVHPLMSPEEMLANAPQLADIVNLRSVVSPFRMASEDMYSEEWKKLAVLAAKELNEGSRGVLVTHGTDVLHYTSAALSFMLKHLCKPVAVVGAQRSPDRGSFDGTMNLACAAHYATGNIAEVAIVMHGSSSDDYCFAVPGNKARKMHSSRRDAFRPINCLPYAKIWPDGRTELLRKDFHGRAEDEVVADAVFEPKVALLKVFPGASPELVEHLVDKKYKGIVIEGTGLGHVPTEPVDRKASWIPAVTRAVEEDVVVAVTSQCLYGRTHAFVYTNLRRLHAAGAVFCQDTLPETAFVKLGWLLGHNKLSVGEVRQKMRENLAGEINPRLTEQEFLV